MTPYVLAKLIIEQPKIAKVTGLYINDRENIHDPHSEYADRIHNKLVLSTMWTHKYQFVELEHSKEFNKRAQKFESNESTELGGPVPAEEVSIESTFFATIFFVPKSGTNKEHLRWVMVFKAYGEDSKPTPTIAEVMNAVVLGVVHFEDLRWWPPELEESRQNLGENRIVAVTIREIFVRTIKELELPKPLPFFKDFQGKNLTTIHIDSDFFGIENLDELNELVQSEE